MRSPSNTQLAFEFYALECAPQKARDPRLPPRGLRHDDDIPPISDVRWTLWTQPLAEFLSHPRDWVVLLAWGSARDIDPVLLRNMVVWLEEFKLAFNTATGVDTPSAFCTRKKD